MNRSKLMLFFIVLTCSQTGAAAQDTLTDVSENVASVVMYDPTGSLLSQGNNIILREIAQKEVISLKKIRLTFESGIRLVLLRYGTDLYLKFSMDPSGCSGDHFYRKFSFTDASSPSLGILSVQLRSAQDSLIIREITGIRSSKGWNDSILLAGIVVNGTDTRFHISVADLRLYYQEEDMDDFHDFRRLADDYYASSAVLDSLDNLIRIMDYRFPSRYPEYYMNMLEIGRIDRLLGERDFSVRLFPKGNDPKNLERRYENLRRFSRSFAMTFESALDTLPVLNTSLPEKTLINNYVEMIRRYIRWSFLINERNGSIYRDYLDRFFEINSFSDDYAVLVKLAGRTYPGLNADSISQDLLHGLKKAYEENADQCTASQQFAEAVELLDHLRRLEERYPFLKDQFARKDARAMAAYGIYASYLGVAENSLINGRPFIAHGYLEKALDYAKSSNGLVKPDTLFDRVIAMYRSQALTECDLLLENGDFQSSLACYQSFLGSLDSVNLNLFRHVVDDRIARSREGIFQQMMNEARLLAAVQKADSALIVYDQAVTVKDQAPESVTPAPLVDTLKPVIDRFRYQKLIRDAGEFSMKMQYRKAYEALSQASEISLQQQMHDYPQLDSLRLRVYPRYVDELLASARPLIWTNQFSQATLFADSLEKALQSAGLSGYAAVQDALGGFRQRISARICWQANDKINVLVIRTGRYVMSRNYGIVTSLLDTALTIIKLHPSCRFDNNSIGDSLNKYTPPATYQRMMQQLDGKVSLGEYPGFVQQFLETQSFYHENALGKFGLTPIELFDYTEQRAREGLTFGILTHYISVEDYREAFRYLVLLRKQGMDFKETREYQLLLGKKLAIIDYQERKVEIPDEMIEKYTKGDEWFRIFGESYRKEWGRK